MALDVKDKTANVNHLTNAGVTEVSIDTPFAASTKVAGFSQVSEQYAYILDASQTGLDLATTFTIEAWVKFTNTTDVQPIVAKDDDVDISTRSYLFYITSGQLHALVCNGVGYDLYNYPVNLQTGSWHHYALTCNVGNASATTFEFFVDGVSVGNGTAVISDNIATIQNTTTPVSIGARYGEEEAPKDFFEGFLDEVRIWNVVRTPTEIANNYNIELTGSETGLVAYYPFENTEVNSDTFGWKRGVKIV